MNNGCETAIAKTGWGLCNYFLVGISGLCSLAEASASLILLVIAPLLACDLKFQKNNVMALNAILSLGMSFGAVFFGTLADNNGRKNFIPITMVIIFCSSIYLAFAQKFVTIAMAIFFLGTGIAGNNVTLRVYLIECLPAKRRGACLVLLDLLWILGYLSFFTVSWLLVPSVVRTLSNEFRPSSWRVLAGLGGAFSLIMACAAGLLPSSPRYLLYKRNPQRALAVLQQIYAINNSRHGNHYPSCQLEGCVRPDENDDTGPTNIFKSVQKYGRKTCQRMKKIFQPPYTRITIFSITSRIFLFPGFVWLAAWKIFASYRMDHVANKLEIFKNQHNESTCIVDADEIIQAFIYNCREANNSYFQYSLLLSMSYIIGEGLVFFGIDLVGRRLTIAMSGMIGGTSIISLLFAKRYGAQIILSIFFLAAYSILYTTSNIIILENYPTSVRGTIFGLTSVLPHLASFLVKYFARVYCTRSMHVAIALIIGATLTALPLPDLTKAPMKE